MVDLLKSSSRPLNLPCLELYFQTKLEICLSYLRAVEFYDKTSALKYSIALAQGYFAFHILYLCLRGIHLIWRFGVFLHCI